MILLVFALLFNICACVDLRYIGGEFGYSVKYLFIEILSSDKPKKRKEPWKRKEPGKLTHNKIRCAPIHLKKRSVKKICKKDLKKDL